VATAVVLGAIAGVVGIFVYAVSDYRVAAWVTIGVLLGIVARIPTLSQGRWFWWGLLGGALMYVGWHLGHMLHYPLVAWALLGAVLGVLCAHGGVKQRVGNGAVGFLAGLVGIHIVPVVTMVVLPFLHLPTTFAYDIEELGFVMAGAIISGTIAWLK
jgi:hypothetical protein